MLRLLIIVCSVAVATSALAQPPDIVRRQTQIREVLESFGLGLSGDELTVGPRGRRDLVLFSARGRDATVLALKQAYRERRALPHGFRIAGWAGLVATGNYTFTLKDDLEGSWVIELADAGGGSRIVIWGLGRSWLPERRPRAELPMRLLAPEP